MIVQITDRETKAIMARAVLEALTDWFAIESARERYIADSRDQIFFRAMTEGRCVGFLCLKETSRHTLELTVMGVLPACHRRGIGRRLFEAARSYAKENGYAFMQVKTVAMGHYAEYDATNRFYQALGFRELEIFPTLWDENNPCQIYILAV